MVLSPVLYIFRATSTFAHSLNQFNVRKPHVSSRGYFVAKVEGRRKTEVTVAILLTGVLLIKEKVNSSFC